MVIESCPESIAGRYEIRSIETSPHFFASSNISVAIQKT